MSEKGSFITGYIRCNECLDAAAKVLIHAEGIRLWRWNVEKFLEGERRIIAGFLWHSAPGEETMDFELEVLPELERRLCHPMDIAVMAECFPALYRVAPALSERSTEKIAFSGEWRAIA